MYKNNVKRPGKPGRRIADAIKKGVPKRDGSGRRVRANRGRGGCEETEKVGRGRR